MFKWLLFDADNTLLDFTKASKNALFQTFQSFDGTCNEQIYVRYKKINASLWGQFEEERISSDELRIKRFELLFRELDKRSWSPTLFSRRYLENLVLASELYDGVIDMLGDLKGKYKLSIVTNGLKDVQRPRFHRLSIMSFFDSVIVSDEIGVAKPNAAFFDHVYGSIPEPPPRSEVLIIGDNLNSDIAGGLNYGLQTCWVSHGKENKSSFQPHFQIPSVKELSSVLQL